MARTPAEAINDYHNSLQQVVSCVTKSVLTVKGYHQSPTPLPLVLANGDAVQIGDRHAIRIMQHYRVVEDPTPSGPYRVATSAYFYTLEDLDGQEILGFHWHPQVPGIAFPHLHLKAGAEVQNVALTKAHIPTGRVSIEHFLRMLIRDLGLVPIRPEWDGIFTASEGAFDAARSW